ncbi:MAG TPA: hypothetical protein VF517_14225 [Thermoleophilaceae bacterium]|jgi:hypothetical protein
MQGGGILDESTLVVGEQANWLVRKLAPAETRVCPVWDRDGQQIGQVEPTDRDSAGGKAVRFGLALLLTSSTRRNDRRLRLVDASGSTLLDLHIAGGALYVNGAGGEEIGMVRNVSDRQWLRAEFTTEVPKKKLFFRWPESVATARTKPDNPPYEFEITNGSGGTIARLTNDGDHRNVLAIHERPDDRVRALLVGFACGLVDRVWLTKPQDSGGGI